MPMLITNSTDQALTLRSFDGDSVTVPPKARSVKVKKKFNWEVPKGILIVKDLGDDVPRTHDVPPAIPAEPLASIAPVGILSSGDGKGKGGKSSE